MAFPASAIQAIESDQSHECVTTALPRVESHGLLNKKQ